MKCAACGYEYRKDGRWIEEVTRYKSGKNKGEIKSVADKWLDTSTGHTEFMELKFGKGVEWLEKDEEYSTSSVYLYACPECSAVRIN